MQETKITLRHRFEYLFFALFVFLVRMSPLFLAGFNRGLLNFIGKRLSKRRLPVLARNLDIAFPHLPDTEKDRLKDNIFRHFSRIFVEIIYLFGKKKPAKLLKPIEINNIQVLHKALEKKKGVILFSAHFGNWELVPYIVSRELDTQLISIARPMDNPLVEGRIQQFRQWMGSAVLYKKGSLRPMLKMLDQNRVVYLLMDHHVIDREAVFVDFFGKEVSAVPSVSQMHIRKEKPIIPVFLHYREDKIVLDFHDEIQYQSRNPEPGDTHRKEDIQKLTQQCTTMIEEQIKKHPEQWFWFHNRWKSCRSGEVRSTS